MICIKAGLKPTDGRLAAVSAVTQEPSENPITFLEMLKEALIKHPSLDLDLYENKVILKDR